MQPHTQQPQQPGDGSGDRRPRKDACDPPRYHDRTGDLIGTYSLAELTELIVGSGVARPIAEWEARRRLGLGAGAAGAMPSSALPVSRDFQVVTLSSADEDRHLELGDRLVRGCGGRVYRLSQKRPSKQSLGLPDRLYVLGKRKRWYTWEAKAAWGRMTEDQAVFAEEAAALGWPHVVGGLGEFEAVLIRDGLCERRADGVCVPVERREEL